MNARVFFAISFSEELQQMFNDILTVLRSAIPEKAVRWTPIHNLHITLGFLGSIRVKHIPELIEQANQALSNTPAFSLRFGKLELFPSAAKPHVISLAVISEKILQDVVNSLRRAILATHYPVEERAFRGHLTLGRLQNIHGDREWLKKLELPPVPEIKVTRVDLLESKLGKGPANYVALAHFHLN
ncbi:RNA 2',3'-cyclic phosphodiesterase [Legionella clemsonensis]|uniref:RNA 2',3'-cyclic phosphodiesterase n=1 Tax=Legionella clemsonensis TaxID=1867846 RepID=A0A222P4X8_9GAMM|nr:RNA 2',3'-cyclic phosphodiesterase [Legionella clemsonensis]ASQ46882.1 2',5' RNA ligase family [Legionella clemsonensis]